MAAQEVSTGSANAAPTALKDMVSASMDAVINNRDAPAHLQGLLLPSSLIVQL
jgi:hypothetical protein